MKRRAWRWVLLVAVIAGVVGFGSSSVQEARYSPFTLEYQKRESLEVFSVAVESGDWKPAENELLNYLQRRGYIEPAPDGDPKWQLVGRFKPSQRGGRKKPFWILRPKLIEWSEAHPDAAALVWRPAFRLLRSDDWREAQAGSDLILNAPFRENVAGVAKLIEEIEDAYKIRIALPQPSKLPVSNDGVSKAAIFGLEDQFLFYPTKYPIGDWMPKDLDFEDVYFTSADGVKLHGWYCPCANPRAIVLHAHGNGGHLAYEASLLRYYQQRLRVASFIFDYRGYGRSEGTASVAGILQDARAARKWLAAKAGLKESQLVLTGQSLGGAVAVDLAADGGARGLVVESTFSSLKDIAAVHFPQLAWLASPKKLNSVATIKNYRGPLLMAHGDADDVIPYELGRKLFDAAHEPKQWIRESGGLHSHATSPEFAKALDRFIENLPR